MTSDGNFLVHIDNAKREILAADSLVKIKDLWIKAEGIRALGQAAKDHELINSATEFKFRCERRLGEMLAGMKAAGEIRQGQNGRENVCRPIFSLKEVNIDPHLSSRAQRIAAVPEGKFEAAIAEAKGEERDLTRQVIEKLTRTMEKLVAENEQIAEPDTCTVKDLAVLVKSEKKYGAIYADPPWEYDNRATRSAANGIYLVDSVTGKNTLTPDEIAALPIANLAAEKAHLHLWTTNAFLFDCKKIIESWGFEYKSTFVWVKPQMGIGNYWRVSHEFLLLGVRGGLTFADHSLMSWLSCDRSEHSVKPEQIRHMIMKASPPPYLELFGRRVAQGWTVWGNEIQKDIFYQTSREL